MPTNTPTATPTLGAAGPVQPTPSGPDPRPTSAPTNVADVNQTPAARPTAVVPGQLPRTGAGGAASLAVPLLAWLGLATCLAWRARRRAT